MAGKRNKIIMLNTLLLIFCCVIIALFCWSPKETVVLEKYKINFETEGGSSVAAIEIEEGTIPEKPKDPTRDGYIFVGWMLGDELYDFTTTVEGDVTLKAVWKEIDPEKKYYIVTIDLGDGTTSSQPVEEGGVPIAPTTPSREGYNFLGWEVNGEPYNFDKPVDGDVTVTAKWEEVKPDEPDPNEGKEFTVRFNLNGGNGNFPDQKVVYKGRATNPGNPTRGGFDFTGWSPNINTPITGDTTFVAQWKERPVEVPSYAVTYVLNNGQSAGCPQTWVQQGAGFRPSCNPTAIPAHHHFSGQWSCPTTVMPAGGVTCTTTPVANTMRVTCIPIDEYGADCIVHAYDGNTELTGGTFTYSLRGRDKSVALQGSMDKNFFADATNLRVSINNTIFSATK